jgi:hypothetical protein
MLLFRFNVITQTVRRARSDRQEAKCSSCSVPDGIQALQPIGGRSNQRRARSDDVNRNAAHQIFEAALVCEGLHESRVFERVQRMKGDAAGDINPACCKYFQRKITSFSAKN